MVLDQDSSFYLSLNILITCLLKNVWILFYRRFSPSGWMIKSPLLSLIPVEKDHTNVTQAFKSHASKDWVIPSKYQHLSFEFLSWKSFTFNFLIKKGCKCGWIFGSLNYRAQLMNIALNNRNCESKYKHYQKVAFIT